MRTNDRIDEIINSLSEGSLYILPEADYRRLLMFAAQEGICFTDRRTADGNSKRRMRFTTTIGKNDGRATLGGVMLIGDNGRADMIITSVKTTTKVVNIPVSDTMCDSCLDAAIRVQFKMETVNTLTEWLIQALVWLKASRRRADFDTCVKALECANHPNGHTGANGVYYHIDLLWGRAH